MKEFTPEEMYDLSVNRLIPDELERLKTNRISSLGSLYTRYRTLATLEWHLHKNAEQFREYMKKAVEYDIKRFKDSKTRCPENLFQSKYSLLLDVLCTGDESFSKETTIFVDDNHDYKSKPIAHLAPWLYRCLVALVLERNADQWEFFMEKLKKAFSTKQYWKLYPYALLLEAIWTKNDTLFHEQLQIVADTHKKLTRSIFDDYEDKLLCLWGIALCNLAKMKGMRIEFDHPFIPKELI
jgi:hypothetical protein